MGRRIVTLNKVDLNCDLGESFGSYSLGNDEEILNYITSANIACGFHAGDPATMRKTVGIALQKGVAIGAHPGLPDLVGFGRRNMNISAQEAYDMVVYQIGALYGFLRAEGATMQHVKPHGALYNMASKKRELADSIARAVYEVDPELILFGLAGGELVKAGERFGLRTAHEVFADRTYREDGTLTPRQQPDAVITEDTVAVEQVITMVKDGKVKSVLGTEVKIKADTICIHGDGERASLLAQKLNQSLREIGVSIQPLSK